MKHSLLPALLLSCFLSAPAFAQTLNDNAAAQERMERLERDLNLLQRQVYRGEAPPAGTEGELSGSGPAQLEVRLSTMEEEMRKLRGQTEENQFQIRKIGEDLEKFQKDTEFRFNEIHGAPAGKPAAAAPAAEPAPATALAASEGPTSAGDGVLRGPASQNAGESLTNPRDHYNNAFRLLNQTKYDEAAAAFEDFTKKYPKDPLIGNAYYWRGETYYIRRDYVTAADSFRQGFEALPTGPKAADNLLKLAMSLDALGRDKEACVVLSQVLAKFKKSSTAVAEKAEQEQKRMGCK